MPVGKIDIVNRALGKLEAVNVSSLDGNDEKILKINQAWDECVDDTFSLHDWTWARRTSKLTSVSGTPINGWSYAFDLPGDRVGPPLKVLKDPRRDIPLREFALEEARLYADVTDVWARCKVVVDPSAWDAGFRAAFTIALASLLAVPINSDSKSRDDLYAEAFGTRSKERTGGSFGRLIAQDRAADPPDSPIRYSDPLTDARQTSGSWYGRY